MKLPSSHSVYNKCMKPCLRREAKTEICFLVSLGRSKLDQTLKGEQKTSSWLELPRVIICSVSFQSYGNDEWGSDGQASPAASTSCQTWWNRGSCPGDQNQGYQRYWYAEFFIVNHFFDQKGVCPIFQ